MIISTKPDRFSIYSASRMCWFNTKSDAYILIIENIIYFAPSILGSEWTPTYNFSGNFLLLFLFFFTFATKTNMKDCFQKQLAEFGGIFELFFFWFSRSYSLLVTHRWRNRCQFFKVDYATAVIQKSKIGAVLRLSTFKWLRWHTRRL